jgi:nucleotide-binding universal stress UspA family protein
MRQNFALTQPRSAVICGIDGSEDSFGAASLASDLAARLGSPLLLAHVYDEDGSEQGSIPAEFELLMQNERRPGVTALQRASTLVAHRIRSERRLELGDPVARLDDLALREKAALLVVASRRNGALNEAALGSVSSRLAATASVPVVVKAPHVRIDFKSGNYELREVIL